MTLVIGLFIIARVDARLGNAQFIAKAAEEVVEGEREKREEAEQRRAKINEALAAAARMGWTENVAFCLVGCSAVAAAAGELDQAGHLLGQAERLCEDIQLKLEVYAEAVRARVEDDLRSRLGEDRLEAVRAEGGALTVDAAVSEALAALD